MKTKKHQFALLLFIGLSFFIAVILFIERELRLNEYHSRVLNEVRTHYDEKLIEYSKIGAFSTNIIGMHTLPFITEVEFFSKNENSYDKVFHDMYDLLVTANISHFSIYDPQGDLLFDKNLVDKEHDHPSFGSHIILQNALSTNGPTFGYHFNVEFQGFHYIGPIKRNDVIVAYVEISIPFEHIMSFLDDTAQIKTIALYQKDLLLRGSKINELEQFSSFFPHAPSYVINKLSNNILPSYMTLQKNLTLETFKSAIKNDGIAFKHIASFMDIYAIVILPIYNYNSEVIGVLVSFQKDNKCLVISLVQIIKFLIAIASLYFLYFLYVKNLRNESLLEQYKEAVDASALVSKTDLKGKITYINDSFQQLSGYTSNELLGKPHHMVRSSSMPSSVFKEMWKTIQKGHIWQGKIVNQKKNKEEYTVNATIVPIKDEKNRIIEYIAIRYDITELEAYRQILEIKLNNSHIDLERQISLVKQYQEAIEDASSFCRFDTEGTITYVNQTMCTISKLSEDRLLHQSVIKLNLLSEKTFNNIMNTVKTFKTWKGIIECQHQKNIRCYLDATFSPIFEGRELKEIMCISNDVTPLYDLYKEIEETQKEVVFTMGSIGETRSKETGNHVKRVAEYSKTLAKLAGLSLEEAELLKQSSPMHDIGKVGIPDDILNKPSKLDEYEWNIMKTHTKLGYNMLRHSSRPILKTAAIVALQHHEKWDGNGYPHGLKGEEIHIFGRITAIADVFDALGSDRCYKKAWELETILQFFREEKGKAFDPKLVDLFLMNINLFLDIQSRFQDISFLNKGTVYDKE